MATAGVLRPLAWPRLGTPDLLLALPCHLPCRPSPQQNRAQCHKIREAGCNRKIRGRCAEAAAQSFELPHHYRAEQYQRHRVDHTGEPGRYQCIYFYDMGSSRYDAHLLEWILSFSICLRQLFTSTGASKLKILLKKSGILYTCTTCSELSSYISTMVIKFRLALS